MHKNLHIHGCPLAIMEADYKIREYRLNIAKLKAAIQTFQEQIKPLAGLCIPFADGGRFASSALSGLRCRVIAFDERTMRGGVTPCGS
jgi:hypothetical protein